MERIIFYNSPYDYEGEALFKKAKNYLRQNKGDKFFYILPNGKLLNEYRSSFLQGLKGSLGINVLTFDDIADKLLEDKSYTYIDKEMKESIISKILNELKYEKKISYYESLVETEGFIKSVTNIIGEIKRSLVDSKRFNKSIPNSPFYKEIGLIYKEYEKFLEENRLIDREESFFKAIKTLDRDLSFFDGLDFIIIDKFFSYRPQEYKLLEKIVESSVDIYINMPFKTDKNYIIINQTLESLKELGFKLQSDSTDGFNTIEKIEDNLNIEVVKTPTKHDEIKYISQKIKKLHNKGLKLNEIGLLVPRPDEYMEDIFKIFKEEKIPSSLNEEEALIDIPFITQFLAIIELKLKNFDKESIINRIKSNYFELCQIYERDRIEFLLRGINFDDIDDLVYILKDKKKKYKNYIDKEKSGDEHKDKLKFIKKLEKVLSEIKNEASLLPDSGDISDFILASTKILDQYNLLEKIKGIYNITKDYDLLYRDISSLSKLKNLFNRLEAGMELVYDNISISQFYKVLKRYLEEEIIIKTQANICGVNILTPVTANGINYKALFIPGLVQGKYPNLQEENFFFNRNSFKPLKAAGLDLKSYEENLDNDRLKFDIAIINCKERLYLTYPERYLRGEENIPSILLDEFINEIGKDKINEKAGAGVGGASLLPKLSEGVLEEVRERSLCERARLSGEYNEYCGLIEDEEIKEDLKRLQQGKKASISFFESYGRCPYRFLLSYILKLKKMDRFLEDYTPLDRGNLYHETLKVYYEKYKKNIRDYILEKEEFSVENTKKEVEDTIINLLKKDGLTKLDSLWQIRIKNMADTILELIDKDLERQKNSKYKLLPESFELEFGRSKKFTIESAGRKIELTGKIDRIDKVYGEDKYVIYDYKSSSYGVKKERDILEGISFQLPVYIMAQSDINTIAAGYIIISEGKLKFELVKEEEKNIVNRSRGQGILGKKDRKNLLNSVVGYIGEYAKEIERGNFSIKPKECDDYCIYKDICRYEGS